MKDNKTKMAERETKRCLSKISWILKKLMEEKPATRYISPSGEIIIPSRPADTIKSKSLTRDDLFVLAFGILRYSKEYDKEII